MTHIVRDTFHGTHISVSITRLHQLYNLDNSIAGLYDEIEITL